MCIVVDSPLPRWCYFDFVIVWPHKLTGGGTVYTISFTPLSLLSLCLCVYRHILMHAYHTSRIQDNRKWLIMRLTCHCQLVITWYPISYICRYLNKAKLPEYTKLATWYIDTLTRFFFHLPPSLLKLTKLWDPNFSFDYLKQLHFLNPCFENLGI